MKVRKLKTKFVLSLLTRWYLTGNGDVPKPHTVMTLEKELHYRRVLEGGEEGDKTPPRLNLLTQFRF